jgi:hypothetical protein
MSSHSEAEGLSVLLMSEDTFQKAGVRRQESGDRGQRAYSSFGKPRGRERGGNPLPASRT